MALHRRGRRSTAALPRRCGFTLIELLVIVAVVGVLLGVMVPALSSARDSARAAGCLVNLRQMTMACSMYAQDNDGLSPALGVPWGKPPFWALVILQWSERPGDTAGELYTQASILVCGGAQAAHPADMERTYAVNVTGHAGAEGDPDDFDAAQVHIRMDRVRTPSLIPLFTDSDVPLAASDGPPPTRTASVIDFRQPTHIDERLGRYHAGAFQVGRFDGSVGPQREVDERWLDPLP